MNDEPPLEELVRERRSERFRKNEYIRGLIADSRYGSEPKVEEIIDYNILEGIESEGVIVEVDYMERVQKGMTKKGYVTQEKKTTGKWDLLEIKGDPEEPDLIDSLTYPVKQRKAPFRDILGVTGLVVGGMTGLWVIDSLVELLRPVSEGGPLTPELG